MPPNRHLKPARNPGRETTGPLALSSVAAGDAWSGMADRMIAKKRPIDGVSPRVRFAAR